MATTLSLLLFLLLLMTSPMTSSLNQDGRLLLSFKYSVHADPTSALSEWDPTHTTPCSWTGVTCSPTASRVTALLLPNRLLLGSLPREIATIRRLRRLDLSNNSLTGSLPPSLFASPSLRILSLAHNRFSGTIPDPPGNITTTIQYLNLSSNRLSGSIPIGLASRMPVGTVIDFSFNDLTGSIPDAAVFRSQKPSAFQNNAGLRGMPFAIPRTTREKERGRSRGGFKPATIAAIAVGDLGAIGLLVAVFLYVYRNRRKDTSSSSETEWEEEEEGATLFTVEKDAEFDKETLLKASAYKLGATGSMTIVYKAVLADGTALAVRRIGDCVPFDNPKDFEAQVRSVAKIRHPNLLRCRGFYWGSDEKLLIHDYAPNGSLAFAGKKSLGWEARLRIARGVARGLAYIHEKKCVHGNVKPSNILLGSDMEAKIGDFGLDRLLCSCGRGDSARRFGSKRSMQSQRSLPETNSPVVASSSVPYQAPESFRSLEANAKWDVYSFGAVLLELVSGRVFTAEEVGQWNDGLAAEERDRIIGMVDPTVRGEVEGKDAAVLSCFKLGFACADVEPGRRPTMKDVVVLLDRIIRSKNGI